MPIQPESVAAVFDLGRPAARATLAARGELGIVWHLPTDRGDWAVKELLVPDGEMGSDMELQRAALSVGLPLPRPVVTASGAPIARIDTATVRVYEWVDLDPDQITGSGVAAVDGPRQSGQSDHRRRSRGGPRPACIRSRG